MRRRTLHKWTIEHKIWETESWRSFLEKHIKPFYWNAPVLKELYNYLLNLSLIIRERGVGFTLKDIEDEVLKEKIKVALYGGVEVDLQRFFAKFMFDYFGLGVEGAENFEDSIREYRRRRGQARIDVKVSWISRNAIENINRLVENLNY